MPILYIHGVSVRDESGWQQVETLLRQYVAPQLACDPHNVEIKYCFWGNQAAQLSWLGSSIPNSPVRHALNASAERIKKGRARLAGVSTRIKERGFLPRNKEGRLALEFRPKLKRLRYLSKERLSDFCTAAVLENNLFSAKDKALFAAAADEVVHSEEAMAEMTKCRTLEEEMAYLENRVKLRFENLRHGIKDKLAHKKDLAQSFGDHVTEGLTRGVFGPTFAATRVMMEMKQPLGQFVTRFIGDVFTYLHRRGDAAQPGPIPQCVINELVELREIQKARSGEPIVVLSHSMGGQIMYDMVTHFLPQLPELEDVRIDFWCASASQVGFFEELKLFLNSSPDYGAHASRLVPFPSRKHLGHWWNVWDHNDIVSYSTDGIIEGVDDEAYNSGMDIVTAHLGYLLLPSFYRKFAVKLKKAKVDSFGGVTT